MWRMGKGYLKVVIINKTPTFVNYNDMKRPKTSIKTSFTQQYIAEKLGVAQPTISNWLKLKVKPSNMAQKMLRRRFPKLAEDLEEAWKN